MDFFRIQFDFSNEKYWFLDEPIDSNGVAVDARLFTIGERYIYNDELTVPINNRYEGTPADFTLAAFDMPVIDKKIGEYIEKISKNIQRIPIKLATNNNKYTNMKFNYEILNVTEIISCIDRKKSKYVLWGEDDKRPDKIGQYRMFTDLKVNPKLLSGYHIFRIMEWRIALVVSDELKNYFEQIGVTGIKFYPVT